MKKISDLVLKASKSPYLIGFLLLITLFLIGKNQLEFSKPLISVDSKSWQKVTLPYSAQSDQVKRFSFRGEFETSFLSSGKIHIIADDKVIGITVNNSPIDLTQFTEKQLSDYNNGIHLDIGDSIPKGKNTLKVDIENRGGTYAISVKKSRHDILYISLYFLAVILTLQLVSIWLKKQYEPTSWQPLIILSSLALQFYYMMYTDVLIRGHDVEGHLEYIKYIATHLEIPASDYGWQTYHPPFYYILAACIYRLGIMFSESFGNSSIQILSIFFYLIYSFYSVKILQLFLKSKTLQILASCLILFWPSGILHSIRAGNDLLFYAFSSYVFYHLFLWYRNKKTHKISLYKAAYTSAFCLLVKSNALLLCALIGVLVSYQIIIEVNTRKVLPKDTIRKLAYCILIFIIGFLVSLSPNIAKYLKGDQSDLIVGNLNGLSSALSVSKDYSNFIQFSLKDYLDQPFAKPFEDSGGRNNYWVYLLKTSLIGEFDYKLDPISSSCILIFKLALLVMITYVITYCLFFMSKRKAYQLSPLLLGLVLFIFASITFRYRNSFSCSGDFRYIYPIIGPVIILFADSLRHAMQKQKTILLGMGIFTSVSLICASAVFFLYYSMV